MSWLVRQACAEMHWHQELNIRNRRVTVAFRVNINRSGQPTFLIDEKTVKRTCKEHFRLRLAVKRVISKQI